MKKISFILAFNLLILLPFLLAFTINTSYAVDIILQWDTSIDPDLAGYKLYYTSASSYPVYNGTGATEGDSPIYIDPALDDEEADQDIVQFTIHGLSDTEDYFFYVTAYILVDSTELESDPSNEVNTIGLMTITSTTANGYYKAGQTINITLNFTEPLTLSGGTLNVTLETGTVDRTVSISSFTSSSSASGTYTVQSGDNSSDLNVKSLSLSSGASLKNEDGVSTYPLITEGYNLADSKDIAIDTAAPDSSVSSKPNYSNSTISIGWQSVDNISGVASTELWYKKGSTGTWADTGVTAQTGTSGTFSYTPTGGDGTYYFDTRSTDNIGNVEASPTGTGYATIYDTVAPSSTAASPSYANSTITITWSASDERSGVASTQLWYKKDSTGTWANTGLTAQTGTSGTFSYTPTEGDGTYYFATRSTDNASNVEAEPTDSGDDNTIYDTDPPDPPSINDYSTTDDTVTLEGTCPAGTYAIYVNGSPNGVTYTSGETTWSYTGTLEAGENTFTVVAYDEAGNVSTEDTFTISSIRPDQPTLSATNTNSLTPALQTGTFSHPDETYSHSQSQWQISTDSSFSSEYLVLDVTSETHLTSLTVPHSILDEGTLYYCRVRFFDDQESSAASDWSDPYAFTSITTTRDQNYNNIPDDQEVDDTVDLDNDGTSDNSQDDIKCVKVDTSIGEVLIGLSIKNSTTVSSIEWLEVIDPTTISDTTNRPSYTPLDLITFKLEVVNAGDTASVTVYFAGMTAEIEDYLETYLGSATWYHYDTINGWQDYSSYVTISGSSKTVRIQLTDGGTEDVDGTANSIIVDPSGIGIGSIITPKSSSSSTSSEEESGCFIDAVGF